MKKISFFFLQGQRELIGKKVMCSGYTFWYGISWPRKPQYSGPPWHWVASSSVVQVSCFQITFVLRVSRWLWKACLRFWSLIPFLRWVHRIPFSALALSPTFLSGGPVLGGKAAWSLAPLTVWGHPLSFACIPQTSPSSSDCGRSLLSWWVFLPRKLLPRTVCHVCL